MRALNRAKLLWGYLRGHDRLNGLPVEYIVETTAKCNLYCPMCPRETHKQPKEDMTDEIFERLVQESAPLGRAHDADRPGRAVPRPEDLRAHRVLRAARRLDSALDQRHAARREGVERLLDTPLEHITLSFDGATKETFEYYRKGARFEKVRDNFVRFARMKHERGAKLQVVVQMVRMEGNARRGGRFHPLLERGARRRPGADQGRRDQPDAARRRARGGGWKHPCHYLWRGPMYVKHNGDVYPCCQSYMLDGAPVGDRRDSRSRKSSTPRKCGACGRLHVERARRRDRHLRALLHHHSASAAGGGQPGAPRQVRCAACCRWSSGGLLVEAAVREVAEPAKEKPAPPRKCGGAGSDRAFERVAYW